MLSPLRDESKIFSENHELERSPTFAGPSTDPANQEPGSSIDLIPKYSEQDLP